jgi:ubiquinone/menaquinone biosynthesis C-methylase UbiE
MLIEQDGEQDYIREIEGVREVYADIRLEGRVLDVGGHQGRLREFISRGQEYVSCDPFIGVFEGIERQRNLLAAYRCFKTPCNFVACHAEHLPFREMSFDTVHMRSVIDHFLDPALALLEARRVLKKTGKLIVGLYVEGGKRGHLTLNERTKEAIRGVLPFVGITRYTDHHVWHPTYVELRALIEAAGFSIRKVHWQKGHDEHVCYIEALVTSAAPASTVPQ